MSSPLPVKKHVMTRIKLALYTRLRLPRGKKMEYHTGNWQIKARVLLSVIVNVFFTSWTCTLLMQKEDINLCLFDASYPVITTDDIRHTVETLGGNYWFAKISVLLHVQKKGASDSERTLLSVFGKPSRIQDICTTLAATWHVNLVHLHSMSADTYNRQSLQVHTERLLKSSLYLSSFTWLLLHSTSPDLQQKAPQTMFTALEWNITCSCTFSPSPSSLEHGCEALWICAFQIATLKTPKPFSFCSFWVWIYWQSRVQLRLSLSSLI